MANARTEQQKAESLLSFAHEFYLREWTIEDARKRLSDCEGDSELAAFTIVEQQADFKTARERYPELIYRYPSLYIPTDEERAEMDRRDSL